MKQILLTLLFIASFSLIYAQIDSTQKNEEAIYKITLKDGSIVQGKILIKTESQWTVETKKLGRITIPFTEIAQFEILNNLKPKEEQKQDEVSDRTRPNHFPYRYFFSPSAIPMPRRTGDFHNNMFYINSGSYAFNDHFSISGGLFFTFLIGYYTPVYLSSKVAGKISDKVYLAGNLNYYGIIGGFDEAGGGIFYPQVLLTFGSNENNLTFGAGSFITRGFEDIGTGGLFNLSFMTRIAPRNFLISQNHAWIGNGEDGATLSLGIRLLGRKHSFDLGLFAPIIKDILDGTQGTYIVLIPYANFQLKIGRERKQKIK